MAERVDRLVTDVDWQQLVATLRRRRLLTTLGPRIVELANGRADDEFGSAVDSAIATGRRHGAFLQLVSLRAMAMLADAGIRSSALKGPLMGEAIYGDPGRRASSDIDLLVSAEQLQVAVDVVRGLGYCAPVDYVYEGGLPLLHFGLVHERGELPPLELHWRIHWYERRFAGERLLPPAADTADGWRPTPASELAALLLFYARDGFVDLRLASDLSAWWDLHGADLSSGALRELVDAYPPLARVIGASLEVSEQVVGLPAREMMTAAPKRELRKRMAVRLANPNPRSSLAQVFADIGLIDGLLTPTGGLGAFVRRQVLPPREVLDHQAQHAARRRTRSRLSRGVGMLARYGLTIARLLRAPERLQ
jgi:hypothetical protein